MTEFYTPDLLEKITADRRWLHQRPELELNTEQTAQYIESVLKDLDCRIYHPIENSVVAFFDNGKDSSIAFRTDMDALPVTEQTGLEFASQTNGVMHACGHDGHMAMMLGFARELNHFYKDLDHNVILIFQPGEESPGGAKLICRSGLLEQLNMKRVYGAHLWPLLEKGVLATRKKELMARGSEVNVLFHGKSVHVARWKTGIDAMAAAMLYLEKAYALERDLPEDVFRLLRFGLMKAGSVRNAVAAQALLQGSVRAFEEEVYWHLRNSLEMLAREVEKETGARVSISFSDGYPAVMNDEALVEQAVGLMPRLIQLDQPEMISEDFSEYQQLVPGVFFFLGTGTGIELHSSRFDFDEAILLEGIKAWKTIAAMPVKS